MKAIKTNQSSSVNDTCTDCGSFVDIGAVIGEEDTVLTLELSGEDADVRAQYLLDLAVTRFGDVTGQIDPTDAGFRLRLNFDVAAEKMIFQLEQGL
ncbi:DUF406 family protein [Shewanella litorisediminis]|uniref:DUF406 family protein n=1 Tax=Shewanella litorisediminis TaxID=1173586 RepID=A0ABX7G8I5_9GAMM|nr:DUF406 family protein [Shewanella litorisediminis]MCL2919307.1 YfcZ/YiiS family protein [Shewanella litorisediminis]QRH03523.1 DUF406 family protein [Shewanella litorisediminis]